MIICCGKKSGPEGRKNPTARKNRVQDLRNLKYDWYNNHFKYNDKIMTKRLKIGLMGGSFNPPHLGHTNSLKTVQDNFSLDLIHVIPAFLTPLAETKTDQMATPKDRLKMLENAFKDFPFVYLDDQEIQRKGVSYSYITVENLAQKQSFAELFFIIGRDQFEKWDQWNKPLRILKKSHVIVTSRTNSLKNQQKRDSKNKVKTSSYSDEARNPFSPASSESPFSSLLQGHWPEDLKHLTNHIFKGISFVKGLKNLYFCQLKDRDISSRQIREFVRKAASISHLVPSGVEDCIRELELYSNTS